MRTVYFVGMHNKPGLEPLDSSTRSGRCIDKIIGQLPAGYMAVKTNLHHGDVCPTGVVEWRAAANIWHLRIKPVPDCIAVCLGRQAQTYFRTRGWIKKIDVAHPAWLGNAGAPKQAEYIADVVSKIVNAN